MGQIEQKSSAAVWQYLSIREGLSYAEGPPACNKDVSTYLGIIRV